MFLDEIVEKKKEELEKYLTKSSIETFRERIEQLPKTDSFRNALKKNKISVIAEVKKASPSRGVFKEDFDPVKIALQYQDGEADAISVLTDRSYFMGSLEDMSKVDRCSDLPILRKDFIIDERQIYEARAFGADAVLIIATILNTERLKVFITLCYELGMDALVEVHTKHDLDRVLECGAEVIGINNRDLNTFQTDLSVTEGLAPMIPSDRTIVSASGIFTRKDVIRLKKAGIDAILVGEAIMTSSDIGQKIRELKLKESVVS